MSKIWRVAKNEYLNIVRTKAFIITVVLMPVFMTGAIAAQVLLKDKVDLKTRRFAVVDKSGQLLDGLKGAAKERNEQHIFKEEKQVRPRFEPEAAEEDPVALSERVRKGELFAYVIIGKDVVTGKGDAAVAYHTETPTYEDLPKFLRDTLNEHVRRLRFEEAGIDPAKVEELSRRLSVNTFGLVTVTEAGEVKKAERVNKLVTFGIPAGCLFLMFMLVMMATPALLNNVLEEKMQRISEILISSVSPFELFLGKLVGTVFVSWTLSVLYLGGITYVLDHYGFGDVVPVQIYAWFLFFQFLALFIFGSIYSGIGAACSELRDAQSMMMPAMLIVMLPMFVWFIVLKEPSSPFSVAISLFPPATPFLMMLRIAIPPGPAVWEVVLAVVLTVGFTLLCVWAAGKIFRIGILAQGQTPTLRRLFAWVFSR